jgi:outer membrane lipoprotein-sorting protein
MTVEVTDSGGTHIQTIIYKAPHKWRIESKLPQVGATRVHVCNGETAWSYQLVSGAFSDIRTWNIRDVAKAKGEQKSFAALYTDALDGILTVADPNQSRWQREMDTQQLRKTLLSAGESKINGVSCVILETSKTNPKCRVAFAKEDGLLREQVFLDDVGKVRSQCTVKTVKHGEAIKDDQFKWTPPNNLKVVDETKDLLKQLDEDQ